MLFASFLGFYFLIGLFFAAYFLFSGYHRILPDAAGTKLSVRLVWIPAAIAIWPILVVNLFIRGA